MLVGVRLIVGVAVLVGVGETTGLLETGVGVMVEGLEVLVAGVTVGTGVVVEITDTLEGVPLGMEGRVIVKPELNKVDVKELWTLGCAATSAGRS